MARGATPIRSCSATASPSACHIAIRPCIAATEAIRRELPDVEVIALTSVLEDKAVYGAVRAGAIGYLLKDTAFEELVKAIRIVCSGKKYLSPDVTETVLQDYLNHSGSRNFFTLSP